MLFVKLLSATQSTPPCGTGVGNTKEKYPLNTSQKKSPPLGTNDKCFQAPEPDEEYILNLCGDTVVLNNGFLVQALSRLPIEEQEMLYLSFYHRLSQEKIGKRYGRSRSATGCHIRKSIRRLYEKMEGMAHEE